MQLAACDSKIAFEQLVQRHHASVRSYCIRVVGAALGEDVAQEVFVALYRQRGSYVPSGRFRSFLFTVAGRRCKNALRNRKMQPQSAQTEERESPDTDSLDALLLEERRRRLHALVATLPEAQRTAIAMRFSAGLDYSEIAGAVGCSEPTARTRVFLGLTKLRALCAKRGEL